MTQQLAAVAVVVAVVLQVIHQLAAAVVVIMRVTHQLVAAVASVAIHLRAAAAEAGAEQLDPVKSFKNVASGQSQNYRPAMRTSRG